MNKVWWAGLLIMMVGVISFQCAANSELLLPAGHWSYKAMTELAKDGLVPSYPYQKTETDTLTRYEMALYLKQLIHNLESNTRLASKLTDREKQLISELLEEFCDELSLLGINLMDLKKVIPSLPREPDAGENVTNVSNNNDDNEVYFDLDELASVNPSPLNLSLPLNLSEPYYFMGEYLTTNLEQKVFFFSPEVYIEPKILLEFKVNNQWDILYSTGDQNQISFVIVKGFFPIGPQKVEGYYFFPIEGGKRSLDQDTEKTVYTLLKSLSENYQVNNLWQFKGTLPFVKTLDKETYEHWRLTNGLQIGEFLISTKPSLPTFDSSMNLTKNVVGFTDIDDWLKNPISIENQPLVSNSNDLFGNTIETKLPSISLNWDNLVSSTSTWPNDTNFDKMNTSILSNTNNYPWGSYVDNQWSSILFNFKLLSETNFFNEPLKF